MQRKNGACVVTFVKNMYDDFVEDFEIIIEGRATNLNIQNEEYNYNLINTCGPRSDAHEQEKNSENYFKYARRTRDSILIGDWNTLLNENMCNKECTPQTKHKTSWTLFQ